jgi:hypothetical protein
MSEHEKQSVSERLGRLTNLIHTKDWDAAKSLFQDLHAGDSTPMAKGSMETRRLLVELGIRRSIEIPSCYFYAGGNQSTTHQIINFLKIAIRVNPDDVTPLRANAVLNIIVKGCTEMLPDSFRRQAEVELYAKAVNIGYPRQYLLDSGLAQDIKREMLSVELGM